MNHSMHILEKIPLQMLSQQFCIGCSLNWTYNHYDN
ncbi:unnamed protein product [Arabidopsis halleri]